MADKEITMVLEVDLECERCNKKITRVLHKIKDKMNINTISFDEKRNLVTISGPFDAEKVRRKLCCEAGRIIKGMDIKVPEEKTTEETEDVDMEEEEGGRKVAAPEVEADIRPLLKKMLEHPRARTQLPPCTCCCGKLTTTQPPAAHAIVAAPASSVVSSHGYEAPSFYYGVPDCRCTAYPGVVIMRRRRAAAALAPAAAVEAVLRGGTPTAMAMGHGQ